MLRLICAVCLFFLFQFLGLFYLEVQVSDELVIENFN